MRFDCASAGISRRSLLLAGLLGVSAPLLLRADGPPARIVFPPPPAGAPTLRHDDDRGRGAQDDLPMLFVLCPRDLGLTTLEMPSLFWYVSGPTDASVKITLSDDADVDPVLRLTPAGVHAAGIQRLDLAARGVRLDREVQYQFAVALLGARDARSPARQAFASGVIKRVRPGESLRERLEKADRAARPAILAGARIWYDALMSLSDLIEADPGNPDLRLERADLLDQVKLSAPAEAERRAAAELRRSASTRPAPP
jgi:hypothetical protein